MKKLLILLFILFTIITILGCDNVGSKQDGKIEYEMETTAMEPKLQKGEKYYFEKVDENTLKIGDIILVRWSGSTASSKQLCSRIVAIDNVNNELVFTLKSDKNAIEFSDKFTKEDIIGIYVKK